MLGVHYRKRLRYKTRRQETQYLANKTSILVLLRSVDNYQIVVEYYHANLAKIIIYVQQYQMTDDKYSKYRRLH